VPKSRKKGIYTTMDSGASSSHFEVEEDSIGPLDDIDNIQILLRNLKDKKHNGCLSPLDRQLLKKIQEIVACNPQHYNSKIGYLQLLYDR